MYIMSNSRTECLAALYIRKYEFNLISDMESPDFWLSVTFGPCRHCVLCGLACSPHIPFLAFFSALLFKGGFLAFLVSFLSRHTFHCSLRCLSSKAREKAASVHPPWVNKGRAVDLTVPSLCERNFPVCPKPT